MKKVLLVLACVLLSASAWASISLNLNFDDEILRQNALLSGTQLGYFNGSVGYIWDSGIMLSFKYDHMETGNMTVSATPAKLVAVIPSLGIGYKMNLFEKFVWVTNVNAGYCMSARYELNNTTNYHATGFAPSATTALYYDVINPFYVGVEAGYRYLDVSYKDLSNADLNLSGPFFGVSLLYIFG